MTFEIWVAFVAASTALLMIPGPTVLLVLSYALTRGRRVATATALGVATGDAVAMTASIAGLGAVVMASATAFTLLKWIGAAYLIWMGVRMLRHPPDIGSVDAADTVTTRPGRDVFRHAAFVTALNPKSIAFFIAFVPQFMTPAQPLAPQAAILIATFVGLAGLNALAWALAGARLSARIRRPGVMRWLNCAGGGALIAMGAATAALRRRPV